MNALMARRNTRLPAMMAKNNLSKRSTPKRTTPESIRRFWMCRFFDSRQAKFRQVVQASRQQDDFSRNVIAKHRGHRNARRQRPGYQVRNFTP
jgi:hypothetical protein